MSVLSRSALEECPLADLHALASEMGIDGFRRLRKADLIDRLLGESAPADEADDRDAGRRRRRRRARGGRRRRRRGAAPAPWPPWRPRPPGPRTSGTRTPADAGSADDEAPAPRRRPARPAPRPARRRAERTAEGVVELLATAPASCASARPTPPTTTSYISAAQVRAASSSPATASAAAFRAPRAPSATRRSSASTRSTTSRPTRSPRAPASTTCLCFPTERFSLGADDPTLKAIEWLTPLGRGSRATIVGGARAGKSEALRLLAGALRGKEGLELSVVLAGVRPRRSPSGRRWRSSPSPR